MLSSSSQQYIRHSLGPYAGKELIKLVAAEGGSFSLASKEALAISLANRTVAKRIIDSIEQWQVLDGNMTRVLGVAIGNNQAAIEIAELVGS